MVDFAKNTNYLNETSRMKWSKVFIGDIKIIVKNSIRKEKKKRSKSDSYESFEAEVIGKTYTTMVIKRLDNNRVESIIFSDVLQGEVEIIRKVDSKAI